MAFFKFRKGGDEQSATPAPTDSVEDMRRRAKHRLIGAAVLVLVGVIGFPMLFDKQPRPIAVDTAIEIPDKNKAKPLVIPAPPAPPVASAEGARPPPAVTDVASVAKGEEIVPTAPVPVVPVAPKVVAKPEPGLPEKVVAKLLEKPQEKPLEKHVEKVMPVVKPVPKVTDAAKAQALLEGKDIDKKTDAQEGRFVVQVGAFADAARAREVRLKVEHTGLKTYTHVAETKEGSRIRVRVGPFSTRAEADKAAQKIKKLDLPAAILTL
jgi:DedD protein